MTSQVTTIARLYSAYVMERITIGCFLLLHATTLGTMNNYWETCPSGWNRMEDAENRLITEPAPIGTDRLGGQRCKYAEKSYMYKYDLGQCVMCNVVEHFCRS